MLFDYQTRVQELETAIEVKDNEALRALKSCQKSKCEITLPNGMDRKSGSSFINRCSLEDQTKSNSVPQVHVEETRSVSKGLFSSSLKEEFRSSKDMSTTKSTDYVLIDVDEPNVSGSDHDLFNLDSEPQTNEGATVGKSFLPRQENGSDATYNVHAHKSGKVDGAKGSKRDTKGNTTNTPIGNVEDDVILLFDENTHDQNLLNISKNATSRLPEPQPGIGSISL